MTAELFFITIELIFNSFIVFFALLVRPRTREFSWLCIIAGMVLLFARIVFQTLVQIGLIVDIMIRGIPVISFGFSLIISTLFITAFVSKMRSNYH
ncbi:MAG: hypothetical protein ACRC5H_02045 [Treponemataceae bacterium]